MNVTIIIPIAFKTHANLEAKSFDAVVGEFTFTNELNAAGGAADAPATHVWCHVASIAPATVDAIEARVSQIPGAMLLTQQTGPFRTGFSCRSCDSRSFVRARVTPPRCPASDLADANSR